MNNSQTLHTLQFRLIGIFLLCVFLAVSAGYVFFGYIETSEKIDTNKTLASVGRLKSDQIRAYLSERKGDAAVISSFLSTPSAQHWLARQGGNAPDVLNQLAESIVTAYQYRGLLLLDAGANIRLNTGHSGTLTDAGKAIALRAMRERTPISFQIYFGDPSAPDVPVLDTFVPVMSADGAGIVGMVVLRNELNYLFPLLQTWPVESETAESLLVTKDGGNVLFLNELRHRKGTALRLRVPLSADSKSPAWPAISAVTGRFGLFEAHDYRGVHILAYTIAVPDTPWGMVVKMDVAEATKRGRTLQKITAMIVMAIVTLIGIIVWTWWRKVKADQLAKKSLEESRHRLVQSEKMLNEAQQLAHLGSWERDLATGSLACSEEIFRIFEIDPAHKGISYEEFILTVHPEDREAVDQAYLTCIRTREPFDIVHRLLFADGRVKWVNEHGTFFYDANGVPLRSIGTIQDITERKQAEKILWESETRYHRLHESMMDAFVMVDMSGRLIDFNCAYQEMLGYSIEELQRLTYVDLTPQKWHEFEARIIGEQVIPHDQSQVYEKEYIRKDGTVFPVELKTFLLRDKDSQPEAMWAIVRDITERKRADNILRVAATAFETHEGITITDAHANIIRVNQAFQDITGYSQAEVLGKSTRILQSGRQDKAFYAAMWQQLLNNGSWTGELWNKRKDGQIYPEWLTISAVKNEQGETTEYVAIFSDITERKRLEEDMQKSEIKFRTLYESSGDAIMLLDEENGFFDCNEATLRLFGCPTRDDFINKHPSRFSPPTQPSGQDSMSLANEHIATAFKDGSSRFEWMHCRIDGTEFPTEILLTSTELNGRQVIQATVRDITERKQAEAKLRDSNDELEAINRQLNDTQNLLLQSDKMASVGQLAAGVAHEINNPIGYVGSNLGTLDGYLKELFGLVAAYEEMENAVADDAALARVKALKNKVDLEFLKEDVLSLMRESQEGIIRVKKIVQDLKDFSRVDSGDEWHRADLHKGLNSTLNVASNEIKYKADVKKGYGDIPEVECVISQLNQVFMNLLVNAAHAIEERGTITLRTGQQGDEVWVEVADTGKGIAPEHINKIFDPFFTTKPVGKGTGLGLSLSYGIIQKHHGRIEVNSEVGKGTSFKVWLPVNQPQDGDAPVDTAVGRVSSA